MRKVPVQKIVMRDGKSHVQTYWKSGDGVESSSGKLPKLPTVASQRNTKDVVQSSWCNSSNNSIYSHKEECIQAGFTMDEALRLQERLAASGDDISSFIARNGLMDVAHPVGGWSADYIGIWVQAADRYKNDLILEKAAEWIDAGISNAGGGVPSLIIGGVSAERAQTWMNAPENKERLKGTSRNLYLYTEELLSGINHADITEMRIAHHRDGTEPVGELELGFHKAEFDPHDAEVWIRYGANSRLAKALMDAGWTLSSISLLDRFKLRAAGSQRNGFTTEELEGVVSLTKETSTAVVRAWSVAAYEKWNGFGSTETIDHIHKAEEWMTDLFKRSGFRQVRGTQTCRLIAMADEDTREACTRVLETSSVDWTKEDMDGEDRERILSEALRLSHKLGKTENVELLRKNGFPLLEQESGIRSSIETASLPYSIGDSEARWMKEMAAEMYWYGETFVDDEDSYRIIHDESVDPVAFKDLLIQHGGKISSSEVEAILIENTHPSVAKGWL